jgi:hypothetical protein
MVTLSASPPIGSDSARAPAAEQSRAPHASAQPSNSTCLAPATSNMPCPLKWRRRRKEAAAPPSQHARLPPTVFSRLWESGRASARTTLRRHDLLLPVLLLFLPVLLLFLPRAVGAFAAAASELHARPTTYRYVGCQDKPGPGSDSEENEWNKKARIQMCELKCVCSPLPGHPQRIA